MRDSIFAIFSFHYWFEGGRDSSVSIVSRPRAKLMVRFSLGARHRVQSGSGVNPLFCSVGTEWVPLRGLKRHRREAAHSPHVYTTRLRMRGAKPSLTVNNFMAWCLVQWGDYLACLMIVMVAFLWSPVVNTFWCLMESHLVSSCLPFLFVTECTDCHLRSYCSCFVVRREVRVQASARISILLTPSRQMLQYYLRLCHDRFLPRPSRFTVH